MSEIITAPWAGAGVSAYSLNRLTGHAENPARRFEFDQLIDVAAPRWLLQVDWQRLDMATTGRVEAFLSRLAAGARFTSPPPLRRRPLAFHTGTSRGWLANPATEASVHAITAGTSTLEVTGLTVGAVISPGDYLSYVATGFTGPDLYNVADTAPVTVGANGRAILRLWPRPAAAAGGVAVRFDGPSGTFRAPQDAISQALSIAPGPQPGTLRLQAVSVAG